MSCVYDKRYMWIHYLIFAYSIYHLIISILSFISTFQDADIELIESLLNDYGVDMRIYANLQRINDILIISLVLVYLIGALRWKRISIISIIISRFVVIIYSIIVLIFTVKLELVGRYTILSFSLTVFLAIFVIAYYIKRAPLYGLKS